VIFATVSRKGGVSKSTLAVHLSVWLYDVLGKRPGSVTLIDTDDQGSAADWARAVEKDLHIVSVYDPDDLVKTTKKLAREYEQIVIDGPPHTGEIIRAILMLCDFALIPCGPSLLDVRATVQSLKILESAQLLRDGMPAAKFIPTKVQDRTRLSKELLTNATQLANPDKKIEITDTVIHHRQAYAEAVSQNNVVTRMGSRAKDAATEIHQLFTEVLYGKNGNAV